MPEDSRAAGPARNGVTPVDCHARAALAGRHRRDRAGRVFPIDEIWGCVEKLRGTGGPAAAGDASEDLRDAEWQLLSRPATERQDADFRAVPTSPPSGYDGLIDQVVLVSRLREVRALLGFTRLNAPERDSLSPVKRISLSRGPTEWVPAVEQRGEGIFLELREDHAVVPVGRAAQRRVPRVPVRVGDVMRGW